MTTDYKAMVADRRKYKERAEKAERELGTELLANAGLLHQLTDAERERDEARGRWWQTTNLYNESTEAAGIWMRESQKAEAAIARVEALVGKWRECERR